MGEFVNDARFEIYQKGARYFARSDEYEMFLEVFSTTNEFKM